MTKATSLKNLAEKIIDGEIIGNQDQLVANWVHNKYKDRPKEVWNEKIYSALRNFENTKQSVLRGRHRAKT